MFPQVLFLVFRLLVFSGNFSAPLLPVPGFSEGSLLAFTYALYYGTYSSITRSLLLGVSHSYATDFFLVACAAEIAGGIHPNGWFLWTVVPAYILYRVVKKILDWVFTPEGPEEGSPEAIAMRKREEKLQRKIKSGRVQLIR
ncbi:conserved hypothetical protein [Neospora caninum Liverpool]|uniref:Uncharacterized protein n=1 Tax=Neospora caninum (strain Liverpool) TaxID=572307 RepID=F0VPW6_NEOCL|nr:conserved hypothetical protein [Neospora caninum Liverpool]CBZ55763.1 conserved hypothetical protein [Neospora caninum Liverpool]|eukprot:XP_003885789.1 conserved hypothetical protein [Neospora caninum Liverpool]